MQLSRCSRHPSRSSRDRARLRTSAHSPPPKGGTQAWNVINSPGGHMTKTGTRGGGGIVGFPYPPKGADLGQVATPTCELASYDRSLLPARRVNSLRRTRKSGCCNEKRDCNPAILVRKKPGRLAPQGSPCSWGGALPCVSVEWFQPRDRVVEEFQPRAQKKKKKRTRGAILAGHFGRYRQDRVGLLVLMGRWPRLGRSFGGCRSPGSGSGGRSVGWAPRIGPVSFFIFSHMM